MSKIDFISFKTIDFCDDVRDGTHDSPKHLDFGKILITSKNIKGDSIDFENASYISEEDYNKINERSLVEINDVLYSMIGTVGLVYRVDQQPNYAIKNMGLFKIHDELRSKWLYYYLNSPKAKGKVLSILSGSTQKFISLGNLRNLKIEFPQNIDDAKKIIKICESIDRKIKLNNEINNNLQELINNIFISKFVNYYGYTGEYETAEIGDIPSDWKVDNLGNVISFSNGYGWNSKDMLENNQPDTYKVFKMGNIKIGGGINKEKTRSWILKEKCSGLERFLSKKGDILMCMTDMKSSENPLLGHTALIDCDDEFVINQRVGIIRCDKDIRWPYIYTMTNLPFFINNIRSKAHSGVQVNLTTAGICDTKVLIPDKDSLEEFYKNVTPMYEEMFILNNEIEKLEELRDTLLPKLMNGEIDLDNIEI